LASNAGRLNDFHRLNPELPGARNVMGDRISRNKSRVESLNRSAAFMPLQRLFAWLRGSGMNAALLPRPTICFPSLRQDIPNAGRNLTCALKNNYVL
jgi:hypothetical protein